MKKIVRKTVTIFFCIIIIIITIIATYFIVRKLNNKAEIEKVSEIYSNEKVQDRIELKNISNDNLEKDELLLQIDGENVIGVIKIPKINFEGLVYEGTSLSTLDKGVGHFENSPYLEGNVCLAAHNYNNYWARLHTLETGDKVTYISFLGTKEYEISNVSQISETDWSKLQNTEENLLTLITCVKGKPSLRLCVQGFETNKK